MNKLDFSQSKQCKFTLSANEIRTFCDCARKRYYSSRDCLAIRETRKTAALTMGTAFHESIAHYYLTAQKILDERCTSQPTIEDVKNALLDVPEYDFTSIEELTPDDVKILSNMLNNYMETLTDDLTIYHFEYAEKQFRLQDWPIEDVLYHGSIDLVATKYEDGKTYFYENKTCKDFRPEIYSRFDIQLHIYDCYGYKEYGDRWGGMILNQVKKSKTPKGYGELRNLYQYDNNERVGFVVWLFLKTKDLTSPMNNHAPCNNYMTCKMCQFMPICMKYGYEVPKTHEEITDSDFFVGEAEDGTKRKMYEYDPREEVNDESV